MDEEDLSNYKFFNRDDDIVYETEEQRKEILESISSKTKNWLDNTQRKEPSFFDRDQDYVYENKKNKKYSEKNNYSGKETDDHNIGSSQNEKNGGEHFKVEDYSLFSYEREYSSSGEFSEDDFGTDKENDSREDGDADDEEGESDDEEYNINENDIEVLNLEDTISRYSEESLEVDEGDYTPYIHEAPFEEIGPYLEIGLKKPRRVFRKRYMPNPDKVGKVNKENDDDIWKGTPLENENFDDIIMPPEGTPEYTPPNDPDDPNYLGEIPFDPKTPWTPWYKVIQPMFDEDEDSHPEDPDSDWITLDSGGFSTEESYEIEDDNMLPEDEQLYPDIDPAQYEDPKVHDLSFLPKDVIPPDNPEVRIWYDDDANEYFDVKNKDGEWETVEKVDVVYPPVPKHPYSEDEELREMFGDLLDDDDPKEKNQNGQGNDENPEVKISNPRSEPQKNAKESEISSLKNTIKSVNLNEEAQNNEVVKRDEIKVDRVITKRLDDDSDSSDDPDPNVGLHPGNEGDVKFNGGNYNRSLNLGFTDKSTNSNANTPTNSICETFGLKSTQVMGTQNASTEHIPYVHNTNAAHDARERNCLTEHDYKQLHYFYSNFTRINQTTMKNIKHSANLVL